MKGDGEEDDDVTERLFFIFLAFVAAGFVGIAYIANGEGRKNGYSAGYEAGQVDAAKGRQHYATTQETRWVRKD